MNAVTETTAAATTTTPARAHHPLVVFKREMEMRIPEFTAALPAHIPAERYARVLMTAVQTNPDLLKVDRRSLFNSAMKCAQDGLLPDGREAALVVYNDYKLGNIAQYMPMIAGLRKKVRNSSEIATWDANIVYEHDDFEYELGDNPFIRHKPFMGGEHGKIIAAYSVAVLKTGEKSREVMTWAQIESIRARSSGWKAFKAGKIKSTPWSTDEGEMARKTVARRHSKVLPMSTDLDDLIRRDDALYDMEGASDATAAARGTKSLTLASKLDALAGSPVAQEPSDPAHDAETGEIIERPDKQINEPQDSGAEPEASAAASGNGAAAKGAEVAAAVTAASAPKDTAPKEAAKPAATTAEERRESLLADLRAQGDGHAENGTRDLDAWLDELNGDEQALLSHAIVKGWRALAKAADGAAR